MKNKDVAELFASGHYLGRTANLIIEENVIYSYGEHFPIAIRLWDGLDFKFIFTTDGYSNTTAKHKNLVLNAIGEKRILKKTTISNIKKYINLNCTDIKDIMLEALS